MNSNRIVHELKIVVFVGLTIVISSCIQSQEERIEFAFPIDSKQVEFAVDEIREALTEAEFDNTIYFFLHIDTILAKQAYTIERVKKRHIRISGGDDTGLMYGGLHMAELIHVQEQIPPLRETINGKPFINKRGLKLDLPLDIRTQLYHDSICYSNRAIRKSWNFEFWKMYLDMMARYRYNVLSLWNPHPFSSMVKLDSFPAIVHENVYGSLHKTGSKGIVVSDSKLKTDSIASEKHIFIRKINIDEKIAFWQEVMQYADNRGVQLNFVFENVIPENIILADTNYKHLSDNKYQNKRYEIAGLKDDHAQSYLRECIKQFLLTYPLAEGVGIVFNRERKEFENTLYNQQWFWDSYIAGIIATEKMQPDREIKLSFHNLQATAKGGIREFSSAYSAELNQIIDLGEHMYAYHNPKFGKSHAKRKKKPILKRIFILGNGDNFQFSMGDAEYTSSFIESLPQEKITAGYLIESDGFVWRDLMYANNRQRTKEIDLNRHWYNLMLWGRMGYNPDLTEQEIKGMMTLRYHGIPVDSLYHMWTTATRIPLLINKFHWNEPDNDWTVEGCFDFQDGFHDVNRFIHHHTLKGSGLINIHDYHESVSTGKKIVGTTPKQVCFQLDSMANKVLKFVESQLLMDNQNSNEYDALMYDLKAWGYLGKYYSNKIGAAYHYYGYSLKECDSCYPLAKAAILESQENWNNYEQFIAQNYRIASFPGIEKSVCDQLKDEIQKEVEMIVSHEEY